MSAPEDLLESLAAIGGLLARLEDHPDPSARAHAQGVVRGVLDFHRAAIARFLEIVRDGGPGTDALVDALARDDLVGSMLALHGLHPVSLESRARAALQDRCPNGWRVECVEVRGAVVRVTLARTGEPRRAADPERVRAWAEERLARAVPDAESVDLTGDFSSDDPAGLVPVERLRARPTFAGKGP